MWKVGGDGAGGAEIPNLGPGRCMMFKDTARGGSSASAKSVMEGARGSPLPLPVPSLLTRPKGCTSMFPNGRTLPEEGRKEGRKEGCVVSRKVHRDEGCNV